MNTTRTAPQTRNGKTADESTKARDAAQAIAVPERPRFKTVLVPYVGWPTEASVPSGRKRSTKR